ncbi:MAG: leucine-rich repeat domain-containing protein [Spirochaetales bacterium]|jgi:Leucine-rich repeat (LRR) protein|nr:leucine-rich repeat domain-containing protein [Spirochaetales bacterium]
MDDLNKKIRENLDGKYLFVYAHEFNEAIEWALKNKIEQIQIRGVAGRENSNTVSDFKEIEKLAPYLRKISFAGLLDNAIINFDSIYSLKKLEKIYILCKQKFSLDVSRFNLKHLGAEYWKGLKNIEKTETLESMVITKYPHENIRELLSLKNLKILHIYSSKIKTLEGIEKLNNLEELSLSRNNNLESIAEIKNIKLLNSFSIEKCKKITDCAFVYEMENIKRLYVNRFVKSGTL